MIQAMLAKKVIDIILKRVMEKSAIRKMRKYVEEDNELDIQIKQMQKTIAKQGRTIEELEKDSAILKKNSHAPQEYICCRKCGCKIAKTKKRR
jgi:predicted metal-dependent peptidase